MHEKIWFDKFKYDDAERKFYEQMNGPVTAGSRQVRTVLRAGGTGWAGDVSGHVEGPWQNAGVLLPLTPDPNTWDSPLFMLPGGWGQQTGI